MFFPKIVFVSEEHYSFGNLVRSTFFPFAMFRDHPAELANISWHWLIHVHLALRATACGEQLINLFDCLYARLCGIATTQGILAPTDFLLLIFFAKCLRATSILVITLIAHGRLFAS